jgi:hypothetical protein
MDQSSVRAGSSQSKERGLRETIREYSTRFKAVSLTAFLLQQEEGYFELPETTYIEMSSDSEDEESSHYLELAGGTTGKEKFEDYSIKTMGVAREKMFLSALETDLGTLISKMEAVYGKKDSSGRNHGAGRHCWREGTLRDGR